MSQKPFLPMSDTIIFCFFLLLLTIGFACTADKLEAPVGGDCTGVQPTYESGVKEIINRTCSYSGCHLDSAPGTYTTYDGVRSALASGKFRQRVIIVKDDPIAGMPPDNVPNGKAKDLTKEELRILQCWLDGGFPEN